MSGRIGILGGMSDVARPEITTSVSSGIVSCSFTGKRLFSSGSVSIGHFRIDPAKIFWDTGAKQTFIYVPSLDMIDIKSNASFPVSGIGASVTAYIYPASIDLTGGIVLSNIFVGVLPCDNPAEADLFDSTDIILGMDVIERGLLKIDGINQKFSFKTK